MHKLYTHEENITHEKAVKRSQIHYTNGMLIDLSEDSFKIRFYWTLNPIRDSFVIENWNTSFKLDHNK